MGGDEYQAILTLVGEGEEVEIWNARLLGSSNNVLYVTPSNFRVLLQTDHVRALLLELLVDND
jgi:hypothetical protein